MNANLTRSPGRTYRLRTSYASPRALDNSFFHSPPLSSFEKKKSINAIKNKKTVLITLIGTLILVSSVIII